MSFEKAVKNVLDFWPDQFRQLGQNLANPNPLPKPATRPKKPAAKPSSKPMAARVAGDIKSWTKARDNAIKTVGGK